MDNTSNGFRVEPIVDEKGRAGIRLVAVGSTAEAFLAMMWNQNKAEIAPKSVELRAWSEGRLNTFVFKNPAE